MKSTSPESTIAALPASRRLRPDVALYAAAGGHILRAGDQHHDVHLADTDLDVLLDALVHDHEPTSPAARAALSSLVDAGLADNALTPVAVAGTGRLASALRAALERMGAPSRPGGTPVTVLDDHLPATFASDHSACWVAGHRVVLSPTAVPAADVAARHHAASRHRSEDPRVAPLADGQGARAAESPLAGPGLELAAVQVAAELLRADRPSHEVVLVDLVALTVSRHPVLPVPPAPR